MSIVHKIRNKQSRSRARGSRDLARALASAPTRASREELHHLSNMGR